MIIKKNPARKPLQNSLVSSASEDKAKPFSRRRFLEFSASAGLLAMIL